VNHEIHIPASK